MATRAEDKGERKEKENAKLREFIQSAFLSRFKRDLGRIVCSQ